MTVHHTSDHGDERRGEDGSARHDSQPGLSNTTGGSDSGHQSPHTANQGRGDEPSAQSSDNGPKALPAPRSAGLTGDPLPHPGADTSREAQHRALRSEKLQALGQMASGVAHDLNQSLSLIAGYGELLERELAGPSPDPRRLREYAAIMRSAAADGGELAKRLLTFSRVQAQGAAVPVGAPALLDDVARLTAPRWRDATRAAGYPVYLSVWTDGDDEALAILGWPSSLRDALTNLVLNAVDALPSGGEIRLGARRDDGWVELVVADTGIGMLPEVRDRIFEPFFTTKGERGTGLGLAQVYAIMQQHGGDIDVRSAPGRGTTFVLRLPAASPVAEEWARPVRPEGAERGSLRVLAVDDDPAHGRMLAAMLGHDGHRVTVVMSAESALERLGLEDFDVVVTDLELGAGRDGWQLAAQVRRDRPDVRVCLVTGWGSEIDPAEATERGVAAVLTKPYALSELLAVVGTRTPH